MGRLLSMLAAFAVLVGLAAANAGAGAITVVMSKLDSPRGLSFGPDGGLYVAEAGRGGSGPCAAVFRGANCFGATGAISRLAGGRQERYVSGLPSVFNAVAQDIGGPHDISFAGGEAYVTIGWGGAPAARAALGDVGSLLGTLMAISPSGSRRVVADVAAFEGTANPAGGATDSNPYGLLSEPAGHLVTDAGGNDLLSVSPSGAVSLVTTFASIPVPPPFLQSEPVPTEVERGPDGALYVSQLTGVPFLVGTAGIYRVVPGQAPQLFAGGFKTITDFTWGPDGSLYVLQYATSPLFLDGPGALIRVAPDRTRTTVTMSLFHPTGVTVGPDGALYVSNNGNLAGVGEVLRVEASGHRRRGRN